MIELTQLSGGSIVVNCDLIETIENIPETKVSLTTGKYILVSEDRKEIIRRIIEYRRRILDEMIHVHVPEKE